MNSEYVRLHAGQITRAITNWGKLNYAEYPWRNVDNDWLGLVAEIMLQRTRASSVVPVWTRFSFQYPSPLILCEAPEPDVEILLFPLGLRGRSNQLLRLASVLKSRPGIPDESEALKKLPGVGDYVSSAFLSLRKNRRAAIIDANIVRWICRMVGASSDGETRRKKWLHELADKLTPKTTFRAYNYGLLDFTMTVCKKVPNCEGCPVNTHCNFGTQVGRT